MPGRSSFSPWRVARGTVLNPTPSPAHCLHAAPDDTASRPDNTQHPLGTTSSTRAIVITTVPESRALAAAARSTWALCCAVLCRGLPYTGTAHTAVLACLGRGPRLSVRSRPGAPPHTTAVDS